jgi:hypothetical protein
MKKKLIIAVIAAIVVIGGGIGGYVYHSNQVKAEKMANYKRRCLIIASTAID